MEKIATGKNSVNWKGGTKNPPEFKEKRVAAKPYVKYPYAFYNKYGSCIKPCVNYLPTHVHQTLPRIS